MKSTMFLIIILMVLPSVFAFQINNPKIPNLIAPNNNTIIIINNNGGGGNGSMNYANVALVNKTNTFLFDQNFQQVNSTQFNLISDSDQIITFGTSNWIKLLFPTNIFEITNTLIPSSNNTRDLGNSTRQWRTIYGGVFVGSGANLTGISIVNNSYYLASNPSNYTNDTNFFNFTDGAINYCKSNPANYTNSTNFLNFTAQSNKYTNANFLPQNTTIITKEWYKFIQNAGGTIGAAGNASYFPFSGGDAGGGQGYPRSVYQEIEAMTITNFTAVRTFGNVAQAFILNNSGTYTVLCNISANGTTMQRCSWSGTINTNQYDNITLLIDRANGTTTQASCVFLAYRQVNLTYSGGVFQ